MRGWRAMTLAVLASLAACAPDPAVTVETPAQAATTGPGTTAPATTGAGASTCQAFGGTSRVESASDPFGMSGPVGDTITTESGPCSQRVVITFLGDTPPGWFVEYLALPVRFSPSDEPVAPPVKGGAALGIRLGSWMPDPNTGTGYAGPSRFDVGGSAITELVQLENFEGVSSWAVGLDATRRFRVTEATSPGRLIVEIDLSSLPPTL